MQKTLLIMRGLPGSGKSTVARSMALDHIEMGGQTVAICSTDSFFINSDGEYVFDASKLGKYHGMNQYKAHRHMFMGTELVIVDNTNTTHKEMEPYKKSAREHGYEVVEILVGEENLFPTLEDASPHAYADYISMCVGRNTHSVPQEAIERMARRFEQ
jgi:tRNA uridine 5-carbamoylmethylation protein Kti12